MLTLASSLQYLGLEVPLSTRKICLTVIEPLIEKILARAKSWTIKDPSYVGRLKLVMVIL